ncbi:MAG: acylphosphatase [Candidatus Omnitrophica bacterium]|nr:acylphosphatase [Candidatus Omnitrophota bacterium]
MKKQVHLLYSGRVQGVGFRFSTVNFADGLSISGWVRNLSGGKVEVMAEGEEKDLMDFLSRIKMHFGSYISDVEARWQAATGDYHDFEIRF